jgi:hypothetical protein
VTTARESTDREDANRRLLENLKRAAEAESPRARAAEWRERDEHYRSQAFAGLMRMSDKIARSRSPQYVKEPLDFPRFSSRPRGR